MNRLLAYEEYIHRTQVEVIVEREGCKTFVSSMLARVKLEDVMVSCWFELGGGECCRRSSP